MRSTPPSQTGTPPSFGRSVLRRGALAGIAGGTVLALWFLVVDGIAGRPFHTPAFLFRVLMGTEGAPLAGSQVVLYTIIHFAAFVAIGLGAAWLVHRLRVIPGILLGAVLGFLLFDLLFYAGVALTGVDVVGYLGWAEVLVGNILAGVTLIGMVRLLDTGETMSWGAALAEHEVLREGLIVGLIGAAAVAIWFLTIDLLAGRVFFTPAALGSVLFHGATGEAGVRMDVVTVLGYTGVHVAAFFVTGLIAAAIVALAEDRHPYVLLGAVLLFVTFETFFIGLLTIVAQWLLDVIPWWSIAIANLVAAGAMGYYLWWHHPRLVAALKEEELERGVGTVEPPVPR